MVRAALVSRQGLCPHRTFKIMECARAALWPARGGGCSPWGFARAVQPCSTLEVGHHILPKCLISYNKARRWADIQQHGIARRNHKVVLANVT